VKNLAYIIPGLGQFIQGRIVAGIVISITFYGSILVLLIIWKGVNLGFYSLIPAWIWVWYFSYLDAVKKGERRRKAIIAFSEEMERRTKNSISAKKD